ncbi:hypothetical protein BaRGS_00018033 [Batillaria attramentaria]|uniref:Uncharacterized protein n=1 Tax=Batillaria attramentaria TaxID=370345 RepID=A0ABD0KUI1_9CAEN
MPRRRKKDNERRRSLVFAESPVENQQLAVTPVLSVDNPITVNCVSVFDDSTVTWVSPQFRGLPDNHGKRRQARRRHQSGANTRHRTTLNKENTLADSSRPTTQRQFPALKFVLDAEREATVAAQGRQPRDRSLQSAAKKHSTGRRKTLHGSRVEKNIGAEYCEQREVSRACMDDGKKVNTLLETTTSFVESPQQNEPVYCRRGVSHVHSPSTPTSRRKQKSKQVSQSKHSSRFHRRGNACGTHDGLPQAGADVTSSPQLSSTSAVDADINRKEKRKSYHSDILLSPVESESFSELNGKDRFHMTALHTKLKVFSCSPSGNSFAEEANDDDALFHVVSKPTGSGSPTKIHKSHRLTPIRLNCDSASPCQPRRSLRLREKYMEALKYLRPSTPDGASSTRSQSKRSAAVLVADTPESEYGLSLRKRQLKHRH